VRVTYGKQLIERLLVKDEPGFAQARPGEDESCLIQRETLAQGLIGIVGKPLAVGDGDEKEIERAGLVA
jgi:hypothetical protein